MSLPIRAALALSAAVLAVGLMVVGSNEVNQDNALTPAWRDHAALNILTDPEGVKAASAANAYVQAYVRENGRLPPVHHGQTVIIPGNPFKDGRGSVGG